MGDGDGGMAGDGPGVADGVWRTAALYNGFLTSGLPDGGDGDGGGDGCKNGRKVICHIN